jgi:sarcosine oxidase
MILQVCSFDFNLTPGDFYESSNMSIPAMADVVVIGLGAFGSATTYQLARRGVKVIGIDQFSPPHDRGSSHGATRITRLAVGEGEVYVPLVKRSNEIWADLEREFSGKSLYIPTGGIIMGPQDGRVCHHGKSNFVQRTIDTAAQFGIPHEVLQSDEISKRFPQFLLRGDELAYYEPDSGVLRPEECVSVQLEAASRLGAEIRTNEKVLSVESSQSGTMVRTNIRNYIAQQVILTAGPWVPGIAGVGYASQLKVMRQVLYWFKASKPAMFSSPGFPVFIWMHGEGDED